jgi:glycosyltransferase involved in cell wall biosynthesis
MQVAADTAAVMVTHNGERFVRQQCESIFQQSLLPAALVVVDDASHDATRAVLHDLTRTAPIPVELIMADGSGISDPKSRVAANVLAGLSAASEYDVAILSDQDDEWLVDRLVTQRAILRGTPGALLVAGDGILIDENGHLLADRLRDLFPIPPAWDTLDAAGRARAALRRPLVTGAASAVSAELVHLMSPVPKGWLHDRWATLVAVARNGLFLQADPVIKYRIHDRQMLGLRQARVGAGRRRWQQVLDRGTGPLQAAARTTDVVRRIRQVATDPAVCSEFSWGAVLRSAMDRA